MQKKINGTAEVAEERTWPFRFVLLVKKSWWSWLHVKYAYAAMHPADPNSIRWHCNEITRSWTNETNAKSANWINFLRSPKHLTNRIQFEVYFWTNFRMCKLADMEQNVKLIDWLAEIHFDVTFKKNICFLKSYYLLALHWDIQ